MPTSRNSGGKFTKKGSTPPKVPKAPPVVDVPGAPKPTPLWTAKAPPTANVPGVAGRPRTEIRRSVAHVFDTIIRRRLDDMAQLDETPTKDLLAIADLYARVGVGFIGTTDMDPADVAQLPAPVFQTLDPDAPLPDGKT